MNYMQGWGAVFDDRVLIIDDIIIIDMEIRENSFTEWEQVLAQEFLQT